MSIHVVSVQGTIDPDAERAIQGCFEELRDIDRLFSTYRPDSDINRIRRGELSVAEADARVVVVADACARAEAATDGLFSASWRGWFDPTGYVKGWAVEEASRRHLQPLLSSSVAVGINAGGDLQLFTAPDADWRWHVGIADPHAPGRLVATMEVANGAVATSGTAERGHHIIDPRTGDPATGVASATIVADSLTRADIWATAAVVAGTADRSWLEKSGSRTGMLVGDDGEVTRWVGATTVAVQPFSGVLAA
ncbi:thiamine biosynthesis lipoprotein [Microbacterium phyllosphaerae]|uniref:FAD:protein FMN transferase n=1 Tax=Microbacterium phyllosphaerae TaxID=124798 RepID=A0ABS4WQA2_9MICO|nr:FAD:protein FMN transferase [Microbacterium phyllosphaerae]MBP2378387.1 thiamine biosynthesis lipoprotein [Microbacterium phyllosphaerae]